MGSSTVHEVPPVPRTFYLTDLDPNQKTFVPLTPPPPKTFNVPVPNSFHSLHGQGDANKKCTYCGLMRHARIFKACSECKKETCNQFGCKIVKGRAELCFKCRVALRSPSYEIFHHVSREHARQCAFY